VVSCTVNLTLQFFAVHFLLAAVATACRNSRGRSGPKVFRVLKLAANTVFLAPMLCILFIAAHVRALQVYPGHGRPQWWATGAFYLCNYSLLLQTLVVIAVPFLPGGDVRRGTSLMKGDVEITFVQYEHRSVRLAFILVQYAPCLLICSGVAAVFASILSLSAPAGRTPPLPPAMLCVLGLTAQFFLVHLGLWASAACRGLSSGARGQNGAQATALAKTMRSAAATVQVCPMLAILFVGLRLRAQQITGQTGAPQPWAQAAMYLSTGAALLQLLLCLLAGTAIGRALLAGGGGLQASEEGGHAMLRRTALGVQALLFLALYGGAAAVCAALFVLTPETAGR